MAKNPKVKIPRLEPTARLSDLARAKTLLKELTAAEVIVYVQLLGFSCIEGTRQISPKNEAFTADRRTVSRALGVLQEHGLIAVSWQSSSTRTIEVLA